MADSTSPFSNDHHYSVKAEEKPLDKILKKWRSEVVSKSPEFQELKRNYDQSQDALRFVQATLFAVQMRNRLTLHHEDTAFLLMCHKIEEALR